MNVQQSLSLFDLILASLLVIAMIGLSGFIKLGMGKTLLIASVRTLVQLSTIGFLLVYIFASNQWYIILAILAVMTLIAAYTAAKRISKPYKGLNVDILLAIALPTLLVVAFTIGAILRISPWYTPQYIIPILGLTLGNSLTAISLCSNQLINSLHDEQASIQMKQSLSANKWEATHSLVKQAINNGMTPTINSMMVVGLVSLPGMMTGQILAGADPALAARYQIMTMFIICANAFGGCVLCIWLILRRFFNDWQQFNIPI